jgi:hypothetical protein
MGFASLLEDIVDRYDEGANWRAITKAHQHVASTTPKKKVLDFQSVSRLVRAFGLYYQQESQLAQPDSRRWDQHLANLEALNEILSPVTGLEDAGDATAWPVLCDIETKLRSFFEDVEDYGPLSHDAVKMAESATMHILRRCEEVQEQLRLYLLMADQRQIDIEEQAPQGFADDLQRLKAIHHKLSLDFERINQADRVTQGVLASWELFESRYRAVSVRLRRRRSLHELGRLALHPNQDRFVSLDHFDCYRLQGVSGSGKTIVLLHRAARLATENPTRVVRVFTINRALSELLQETLVAVHGSVPANLHVSCWYDLCIRVLAAFDSAEKFRLVDPKSSERIDISWRDFTTRKCVDPTTNVFATKEVRSLVQSITAQGQFSQQRSMSYLRDEMIYIQGGFRRKDRQKYLTDRRVGRCIGLKKHQREACLRVLAAWEEWLAAGHLCDVHGVSLSASEYLLNEAKFPAIRERFPTDHILVDEAQDFSTLELRMVRKLNRNERGENAFFFAGDVNQKVYAKQFRPSAAGFNFQGRSAVLAKNYRNTKQILQAAYCLPNAFQPLADEPFDVCDPELSEYDGDRPLVFDCSKTSQIGCVVDLVLTLGDDRVAVVSEDSHLTSSVCEVLRRRGVTPFELIRNDDIDCWRKQQGNPLSAKCVVGHTEAVKGFEFDAVIVADLSDGVMPGRQIPKQEWWRSAAILYSALTRARDHLFITFVDMPSVFLETMRPFVDLQTEPDGERLAQLLGMRRRRPSPALLGMASG